MSPVTDALAKIPGYRHIQALPRMVQLGLVAGLIALIAVAIMWSRGPTYSVLFSNLDDRDGGAIVNALTQQNVPYQFSDNGGAILVPQDQVHEIRMQLASQGLPRGGNVGFELVDQARFGASQFAEQVTYQRALEGELANTVRAVHNVQEARVHLALPKESLFVRDRQKPTASVFVTLYPGRSLSESQVSAITWLVSSSVSNLSADNVSVVDQDGHLLTQPTGEAGAESQQRNLVNDIEHRAVQRILTILNPLLGPGNFRAQVSADVDFSRREHTSEVYKPNQRPGEAAIRSEQSSTAINNDPNGPRGIPGALTNQPPANAEAPLDTTGDAAITQDNQNNAANANANPNETDDERANRLRNLNQQANELTAVNSARSDVTTNYEVDRTISHVKGPVGELKRLSVAVVVNYRPGEDKDTVALEPEELESIRELVKQAVGYDLDRGDTISVVNSRFAPEADLSVPFWKNNEYLELGMTLLKYLAFAVLFFFFWRIVINPIIQGYIQAQAEANVRREELELDLERQQFAQERAAEINRYEDNLSTARSMAEKDPRAVAMVLRSWMNQEKKDE